jgi:hypothetical protein
MDSTGPAAHKRQLPRVRRRLRVFLEGTTAFTADVSTGGFCAELMKSIQRGATVKGTITLAGRDCPYVGEVRWARPGDRRLQLPGRIGIRFLEVSPEFAGLFASLVQR